MIPVKTNRHPLKFFLTCFGIFIFFVFLGSTMIYALTKTPSGIRQKLPPELGAFIGVLVIILGFYTVWRYFRNAPVAEMDDSLLRIGNEMWSWQEVKSVKLTGKCNFPYVVSIPAEAITVRFTDGTERMLFDDMYENAAEMKLFLDEKVNGNKSLPAMVEEPDPGAALADSYIVFKGNAVFSFRGLLLWMLPVSLAWISLSGSKKFGLPDLFTTCLSLVWIFFNGWMMCYFRVGREYFQVRNHYLPWMKRLVRLDFISEVVYEQAGKQPNTLRLITKDFKNRLYRAGSLKDSTWLAMKAELKKSGIRVRNECI